MGFLQSYKCVKENIYFWKDVLIFFNLKLKAEYFYLFKIYMEPYLFIILNPTVLWKDDNDHLHSYIRWFLALATCNCTSIITRLTRKMNMKYSVKSKKAQN